MRTNNTRRWTAMAVAGALVALGSTACGSDDSSKPQAVDLSNVSFTGAPIKVMTASSYGNDKVDLKDPITVAQAAADQINLKGGIAGHKLVVVSCNDGGDANSAASCARKAASEHVAAYVGGTSLNPAVVMPILQKAGIPWISSEAVSAEELSSKFSYPLNAGFLGFGGTGAKAVQDGCKDIAVLRYDLPVAAGVVQMVNGAITKAGGRPGTDVPVPPTATTFDSIAAQLANYDCAISAVPSQGFLGIVAATRQAGGKTTFYTLAGTLSGKVLEQGGAALDGVKTSSSFPVDSDPIWDDAKAAAPSDVDWAYMYTQQTWVGYLVLADVLKGAKQKTIDAAAVQKALSSDKAVDTGGFTPTLDFTKELPMPGLARVFNTTLIPNKVENGQLVTDGKPVDLAAGLGG